MNSLRDMVNIQFGVKGQGQPATLTFGQDHPRSCHFEGLPTSHLWSKFEKSTMNSMGECSFPGTRISGNFGIVPGIAYLENILKAAGKNCLSNKKNCMKIGQLDQKL